MDYDDAYDELLRNGMFRNEDPPDLRKPLSGSNDDTADCPGETDYYNHAISEVIEYDQNQSLKAAFPEDY
jgi:hypothetical protein